jgi:hypothetical protein
MTINPYFRRNVKGEQNLLESLTTEAIKIHGHEMIYIPRETVQNDKILGEEVSEFYDANRIEMYLEDAEGYQGESEMSRFGLDIRDSATFIVSRKRFMEVMGHHPDIRRVQRPREGDLIFFDYPYNLFEIKFVKHDNPFYPGGDRYSFKLDCEAFKSSSEKFNTGETEMDTIVSTYSSYMQGITLSSGNGTFAAGEQIYTGPVDQKKAYATVVSFVTPIVGSKVVNVNMQEGKFQIGDLLIGVVSGASYTVGSIADTDTRIDHEDQQDNGQIDLETNRDNIFDFTEKDPFSEGNY